MGHKASKPAPRTVTKYAVRAKTGNFNFSNPPSSHMLGDRLPAWATRKTGGYRWTCPEGLKAK